LSNPFPSLDWILGETESRWLAAWKSRKPGNTGPTFCPWKDFLFPGTFRWQWVHWWLCGNVLYKSGKETVSLALLGFRNHPNGYAGQGAARLYRFFLGFHQGNRKFHSFNQLAVLRENLNAKCACQPGSPNGKNVGISNS
jgi:hypothetical protein